VGVGAVKRRRTVRTQETVWKKTAAGPNPRKVLREREERKDVLFSGKEATLGFGPFQRERSPTEYDENG
jgi:hypothetical protein